jgi:hypothetical protein
MSSWIAPNGMTGAAIISTAGHGSELPSEFGYKSQVRDDRCFMRVDTEPYSTYPRFNRSKKVEE